MIVDVLIEARLRAAHSCLAELTPKERELLAEIAAGKSNGRKRHRAMAIAESLFLTNRAVEKHVNSIFSKLGLRGPGRKPARKGNPDGPGRGVREPHPVTYC